jgi:hypothetical protein
MSKLERIGMEQADRAITVGNSTGPIDLRNVPGAFNMIGQAAADPEVSLLVAHEEWVKLKDAMIETTGKSLEQLAKEIKEYEKQGLIEQSRDAFRIRMIERQRKPKLFLFDYHGRLKPLNTYINGESVIQDGDLVQISPPHGRTWIIGEISMLGTHIEDNRDKILAYWKGQVPKRFSEVVNSTWEQVSQMM